MSRPPGTVSIRRPELGTVTLGDPRFPTSRVITRPMSSLVPMTISTIPLRNCHTIVAMAKVGVHAEEKDDVEGKLLKSVVTIGMLIKILLFLSGVLVVIGGYEIKRLDELTKSIEEVSTRLAKLEAPPIDQSDKIATKIVAALNMPLRPSSSVQPPPAAP